MSRLLAFIIFLNTPLACFQKPYINLDSLSFYVHPWYHTLPLPQWRSPLPFEPDIPIPLSVPECCVWSEYSKQLCVCRGVDPCLPLMAAKTDVSLLCSILQHEIAGICTVSFFFLFNKSFTSMMSITGGQNQASSPFPAKAYLVPWRLSVSVINVGFTAAARWVTATMYLHILMPGCVTQNGRQSRRGVGLEVIIMWPWRRWICS